MRFSNVRQYLPEIAAAILCLFVLFYKLGAGEIQPWDESLYLIRAKACILFGCWLDQTSYSIGGLYSSTHPPLAIWMLAGSSALFGDSPFVLRLVSAFAAATSLLCCYLIIRELYGKQAALITTLMLAGAQGFIMYEHSAQLDIPMFAWIMITVYLAIRALSHNNSRYLIFSGLAFGCALLTKAFQGFYVVPFLFVLPYLNQDRRQLKKIFYIVFIGMAIASPWYVMMAIKHPEFIQSYGSLVASMDAGKYADRSVTQWWYYINQLLIDFPLLVLLPVSMFILYRNRSNVEAKYRRTVAVSVIWLFLMVLFVSVFRSRMPHFVLFLLLPAVLSLAAVVETLRMKKLSVPVVILSSILVLLSIGWSADELIRLSVRTHESSFISEWQFFWSSPVIIIAFVLGIIVLVIVKYWKVSEKLLFACAVVLIIMSLNRWEAIGRSRDDGASTVAEMMVSHHVHTLSALHEDYAHEQYMPQLNYYTNGWLLGWDSTRRGRDMTWQTADSLLAAKAYPLSDASILYVSWDEFKKRTMAETALLDDIKSRLQQCYRQVLQTKKYRLYWDPVR